MKLSCAAFPLIWMINTRSHWSNIYYFVRQLKLPNITLCEKVLIGDLQIKCKTKYFYINLVIFFYSVLCNNRNNRNNTVTVNTSNCNPAASVVRLSLLLLLILSVCVCVYCTHSPLLSLSLSPRTCRGAAGGGGKKFWNLQILVYHGNNSCTVYRYAYYIYVHM